MLSKIDVEVCVNSISSEYVSNAVMAAEQGGASRVELCAAMAEDVLTPAREYIEAARIAFNPAGLLVMVRPRGGSFSYSLEESDVMVRQIRTAAEAGADGVVFGGLRARDNAVDESLLQRLVDVAKNDDLEVTFHRAFDATPDLQQSLDRLMHFGVDRVLTSGTPWGSGKTALQGIKVLDNLIAQAGHDIEVVIGGGVTPNNSRTLLSQLSSARGADKPSCLQWGTGKGGCFTRTCQSISRIIVC